MANAKITSGIVALVVTALLVGGVVYAKNASKTGDTAVTPAATADDTKTTDESTGTTDTPETTTDPGTTDATAQATNSTYKDGTYSATGSYSTPGGQESITVSVTLKDDTITATSATSSSKDRDSQEYQSRFISGYKSLVVGKKISDVQLSQVSGSSLTGNGFNNALDQIERQAAV